MGTIKIPTIEGGWANAIELPGIMTVMQNVEFWLNTYGCGGTNKDELYAMAQDGAKMSELKLQGERHQLQCARFWDKEYEDALLLKQEKQKKISDKLEQEIAKIHAEAKLQKELEEILRKD